MWFLLGVFGAVSTAFVTLRDINMEWDTSAVEVVSVPVAGKRISTSSKGGKTYYVSVADWTAGAGTREIRVSSTLYGSTRPGQQLAIHQQAGHLGARWVRELIPTG